MSLKIIKGEKTFLKLDKLLKDNKSKLSVGFFKGQMRKSGNKDIPQAQIVYWNEFGTDDKLWQNTTATFFAIVNRKK